MSSSLSTATPIVAPAAPKTARSKRAQQAREPQLVEHGAKTAMFVRGSGISERVKVALSELNQLKKPHSISFSKANVIRPFEDASSLSFWSVKNDASLFLVGTHNKKRPHGLVWVRCFSGEVMEMLEVGIEEVMPMSSFKGIKSSPGAPPLFHFASTTPNETLWDSHPTFAQFKSLMLDFFRGVEMDGVALKGLERVISITVGATSSLDDDMNAVQGAANGTSTKPVESLIDNGQRTNNSGGEFEEDKSLPLIHFRTYMIQLKKSGVKTPLIELVPHGPHFTFKLRRSQPASPDMWKAAMKKQVKKSSESTKKNKNVDIDAMGDKVGHVYMTPQDLSQLQARKFKGLKRQPESNGPKDETGGGRKRSKTQDENEDEDA
ncbi:rRNA-binding ribosome biosynthesis protein rpf2 [Microbotryomycetes sp. JL221]|nr:rRNA-binding ribosome biosynthesis protein rpf2 [Microbotryomycetes sp. JL221]